MPQFKLTWNIRFRDGSHVYSEHALAAEDIEQAWHKVADAEKRVRENPDVRDVTVEVAHIMPCGSNRLEA